MIAFERNGLQFDFRASGSRFTAVNLDRHIVNKTI